MTDGTTRRRAQAAVATALLLLPGLPALAQTGPNQKLEELLARLTQSIPAPIDDGYRALDGLAGLNLDPAKLPPDARVRALQIEVIGALTVGDSARALARLGDLKAAMEDAAILQMLTYQAPLAAGDARQALAAIEAAAAEKTARVDTAELARTRRGLERVGMRIAPDVVSKLGESAARKAIVVDLWSEKSAPGEPLTKALQDLHAGFETELAFELIGVNVDGASAAQKARAAVEKRGYKWRQLDDSGAAAELTRALNLGQPPRQVLIDARGFVRAAGLASDPAFVYAVRAAVAEARGDFAYVAPVTTKGERVGPATGSAGGVAAKAAKKEEPPKGTGDLPSNPDAEAKLNTARAFLKTGKKTDARRMFEEIVRDYPGTREAKIAQEFLDTMP